MQRFDLRVVFYKKLIFYLRFKFLKKMLKLGSDFINILASNSFRVIKLRLILIKYLYK